MNYEIDFLPVGDESKGGDAICFRYWGPTTPQFVGVIDGGHKKSGSALVNHIKEYYQTDTVDVVIATHPHSDHVSGLPVVLEKLNVRLLMMHKPWEHGEAIKNLFQDGRVTEKGINDRVRKALQQAYDLHEIALQQNIPIIEPFTEGERPSPHIAFLSPTKSFYEELLMDFTSTPGGTNQSGILEGIKTAAKTVTNWIVESWDKENLIDPIEGTNAENNSSTITLLNFDESRILLTADAGVPALKQACDIADEINLPLQSFKLVQIPHHGSKRNVGPTILNRLIGPPVTEGIQNFCAYVSAPVEGEPKHPSRRVSNAFTRRGAKVIATKGGHKCFYSSDTMARGWGQAVPLPFYTQVEND